MCIFGQMIIKKQKVMEKKAWLELVFGFHMMKPCGSNASLVITGVVIKEQIVPFRTSSFGILLVLKSEIQVVPW